MKARHSLGGGDKLAKGAKRAQFSLNNVMEIRFDYCFLTKTEFLNKWGLKNWERSLHGIFYSTERIERLYGKKAGD